MEKRHAIPKDEDARIELQSIFNLAFFALTTLFACSILGLAFALFFTA